MKNKNIVIFVLSIAIGIIMVGELHSDIKFDSLNKTLKQCSWQDSVKIINELATFYLDTAPSKVIELGKKSLLLAERKNDEKSKAFSYMTIGLGFELSGQYDLAISYYKDALLINEKHLLKDECAKALNNIGIVFFKTKEYDSARVYYSKVLNLWKEKGDKQLIAQSLYNMGGLLIYMGKYDEALKYAQELLEINLFLNNKIDIANSYGYLGFLYQNLNKLPESLNFCLKELKLKEELNDKKDFDKFLANIGIIYFKMKKLNKSEEYYKKALQINEQQKNIKEMAKNLSNLGNIFYESKQYPKALDYYHKSLELTESNNFKNNISPSETVAFSLGKAVLLNNLGLVYKHLGDYRKALNYCSWSVSIKEELGEKSNIFYPLTSLAEINLKLHNYADALILLDRSLKIAKENNNQQQMKEAYFLMYEVNSVAGNYKNALESHLKYTQINDSIIQNYNNKLTSELQTKYETERKEIENKALRTSNELQQKYFLFISALILITLAVTYSRYRSKRKANQMLKEKNDQIRHQHQELEFMFSQLQTKEENLREANITKDKFFSIIGHDLKNPLHAITLSSELLINNYKYMNSEELEKFIKNINQSGTQITQLLENLLEWARSQSGKITFQPKVLQLKKIIEENIQLHEGSISKKNIHLFYDISNEIMVYADDNMLHTIIRNLISNAVKFSYEGGRIRVEVTDFNIDFYSIAIIDEGIGISESDMDKLFQIDVKHSTVGTSKEKGTGLGLIICREFIQQNGGMIIVESKLGVGSKFSITIPKNSHNLNLLNETKIENIHELNLN
jgi:signal transduction histidine kinase/Tfp pilus assembly protein PilF